MARFVQHQAFSKVLEKTPIEIILLSVLASTRTESAAKKFRLVHEFSCISFRVSSSLQWELKHLVISKVIKSLEPKLATGVLPRSALACLRF
jgi:hypothetical protein